MFSGPLLSVETVGSTRRVSQWGFMSWECNRMLWINCINAEMYVCGRLSRLVGLWTPVKLYLSMSVRLLGCENDPRLVVDKSISIYTTCYLVEGNIMLDPDGRSCTAASVTESLTLTPNVVSMCVSTTLLHHGCVLSCNSTPIRVKHLTIWTGRELDMLHNLISYNYSPINVSIKQLTLADLWWWNFISQ